MPRGTLTLYDVPPEVRAKGAAQARQQLHTLLSNPHLSKEQRQDLLDRLNWASKWEALNISDVVPPPPPAPPELPPAPPREPQHHVVEVVESLSITEE